MPAILRRIALLAQVFFVLCAATPARAVTVDVQAISDLNRLSIEQLANIPIYSVSKSVQPLSDAPAAIFVITHDDIIRSGAASLPEMLRLAPNLQVAQITASSFAISARGFNGSAADKLLVLIDGRSVYTPFFNGVFWDAQRVLPDDIDRIEVISGPGATLWGANAVNGVINIVTRKTGDTEGFLAEGGGGPLESHANVQLGGALAPDVAGRIYFMFAQHGDDHTASGASAKDAWRNDQGGFRLDWTPGRDVWTLQGDLYRGHNDQSISPPTSIGGQNLLVRWNHPLAGGSTIQVQAYYDELRRRTSLVEDERQRTYDLDAQHSFSWRRQQIVWGGGVRVIQDRFLIVPGNVTSPLTQFFDPEARTLTLGNLFAQDTVTVTPTLNLVMGVKLEDDAYVGLAPLPSLRLSWKPNGATLLWAAVSRAVRAPSRLDRDFFETLGRFVVLKGDDFQSEELNAYEIGYRGQPLPTFSISVSSFYNDYPNLRSFEPPPGKHFPLAIENMMQAHTYGVEAWASYQATGWWRLAAGANWLHEDLRFKPGSARLGGVHIAGNDPAYQASLRSSMDLPCNLTLDAELRGVGALPDPASPAYVELNSRLAWAITKSLEFSVVGANLLHDRHAEFGEAMGSVQLGAAGVESERSVVVGVRWRP
jgi:iron complex outermembrane receptor protein